MLINDWNEWGRSERPTLLVPAVHMDKIKLYEDIIYKVDPYIEPVCLVLPSRNMVHIYGWRRLDDMPVGQLLADHIGYFIWGYIQALEDNIPIM